MPPQDRDSTLARGATDDTAAPVLFWAERDPRLALASSAAMAALALPFALVAPAFLFAWALLVLATSWLNLKSFRFELTADELRLRAGVFASVRSIPLAAIHRVEVRDLRGRPVLWGHEPPSSGHLLLHLAEGVVPVAGIRDPQEAAEAVAILQRGDEPLIPTKP